MKNARKPDKFVFGRIAVLLVCLLAALGPVCVAADTAVENETPSRIGMSWDTLHTFGDPERENTKIVIQQLNGADTLILPSAMSPSRVTLYWDELSPVELTVSGAVGSVQVKNGEAFDLSVLCEGEDYAITLRAGEEEYALNVLFSEYVSAMYLVSDDPVNEGRAWVESSADKSNKATGSMILQKADGSVIYSDRLTQIKGRGNSTWKAEKKPYQIKLESKADLLETGNKENKSKTWILLANHYDPTLLRNTLMLNFGSALGMEFGIETDYVDLYYDGEYRGSYLLTEKVEVGSGRVDITNLEVANEEANPEQDVEDLPVATATTSNGATYTYCVGMVSPADITGGYLLEMDLGVRAVEEVSYFYTKRGEYVVVKSPEYASKEEMEYIATLYQEYEDAVYNGGIHPENGKAYTQYVDLESTVRYYLLNEFAKNRDVFHSSTYLYKEAGTDVMTMGPLWDYDLCLGKGGGEQYTGNVTAEGISAAGSGFGAALMKLEDFRTAAKEMYEAEIYPLIKDVILGDVDAVSETGVLHSLACYAQNIAASARCNAALWGGEEEWSASVSYLEGFMTRRVEWLQEHLAQIVSEEDLTFSEYIDVSENHWFYEGVHKAKRYGLMYGTGGDTFEPYSYVRRAHVAQVLYRMAGEPLAAYEQKFSDVSPTDWFGNGITWAANTKLITGYPDGTFKPNQVITREDLAVLLYRYIGSPESSGAASLDEFADGDKVSNYARDAVIWAVGEGLIQGYDDRTIQPQGVATRAELAVLLVRFYDVVNGLNRPEEGEQESSGTTESNPVEEGVESEQPGVVETEGQPPEEDNSQGFAPEGTDSDTELSEKSGTETETIQPDMEEPAVGDLEREEDSETESEMKEEMNYAVG